MSDIQSVLEARARRFARPLVEPKTETRCDVVYFEAGGEPFAIEAAFVGRIVPAPRVIPLPGAPPHLAGIANVRGQLLPVFDLVRLLGSPTGSEAAQLVVLGRSSFELCIVAGAVTDIVPLAAVPRGGERGDQSMILRTLADGRTLIDGAALLDDPRLAVGTAGGTHLGEDVHG